MITVEDCVKQLETNDPNMKVKSVKDYGPDYLITYEYDGLDEILDPFILINKSTGKTSEYSIAYNLDKYYSAKELL